MEELAATASFVHAPAPTAKGRKARMDRRESGFILADDLLEFGFVLGLAAGARFGIDDARGFGLADALPRIGLDRLGRREFSWLAFRHGKYEYGVS